jgi:hypothetical protein
VEHSTKEELVQFTFVFQAQAGEYKGVAFDECMTEEIEKKSASMQKIICLNVRNEGKTLRRKMIVIFKGRACDRDLRNTSAWLYSPIWLT